MQENENQQKKEGISEDLKDLVIERLDVLSPHKKIYIGSVGAFTKDELIERVRQGVLKSWPGQQLNRLSHI